MPILPLPRATVLIRAAVRPDPVATLNDSLLRLRESLFAQGINANPSLQEWDRLTRERAALDPLLDAVTSPFGNTEAFKALQDFEQIRTYVMSDPTDRDMEVVVAPLRQKRTSQIRERIMSMLDHNDYAGIRTILDEADSDPLISGDSASASIETGSVDVADLDKAGTVFASGGHVSKADPSVTSTNSDKSSRDEQSDTGSDETRSDKNAAKPATKKPTAKKTPVQKA